MIFDVLIPLHFTNIVSQMYYSSNVTQINLEMNLKKGKKKASLPGNPIS